PFPPDETLYTTCNTLTGFPGAEPGNAQYGYQFVAHDNLNRVGNDFGNFQPPVCPEDTNRAPLLTRTVGTGKAGGTGAAGSPIDYPTLQAAHDATQGVPITKDEVIGMFSKTTENVLLGNYTAKSMTITQCTNAQITAANANYPVWKLTANRPML